MNRAIGFAAYGTGELASSLEVHVNMEFSIVSVEFYPVDEESRTFSHVLHCSDNNSHYPIKELRNLKYAVDKTSLM